MKTFVAPQFLLVCLVGCGNPAQTELSRVSSPLDLDRLVGRRVELVGIVSDTKCPQILGVDLWELEGYRGRKMRVTGILRKSVVTQAQIEQVEREVGGPFAHRGPGVFYHLDDLEYDPEP